PGIDYAKVPWCVYTRPEAAFTGMSEEQAKEAGLDVVVQKSRFNHNGRAMIVNQAEGMVKVVAERDPDGNAGRILGVHMAGPWVTEQLGQGYLAVNWEATVEDMAVLIQPHHTMAGVLGEARISRTGRPLHGEPPNAPTATEPRKESAPMADITMPQLGETVTEGTITKWFKQVGETVAEDEPLFEVSTDKVDSEVPSPVSGTLVEIKVPEGETVDVGAVLAVVGDAGDAPAPAPVGEAPAA